MVCGFLPLEPMDHSKKFIFWIYWFIFSDLQSMVSVGLATIASCNYDLKSAVEGKKKMRILCIGHGGGSLPLFLASKIQGESSLSLLLLFSTL